MEQAQDIISDALRYRYNEDRRARMSVLDRMLDFSDWGKNYQKKGEASAILYISERLMKAQRETDEWRLRAEIYRREALRFSGMLSQMGGAEMEKRAEEEIEKRLRLL